MVKQVEITVTGNPKYFNEETDEDYAWVEVKVKVDGQIVGSQCASESLSECPEDAVFYRDLPDPGEIVGILTAVLANDPNYKLTITDIKEE